MKVGVIGAGRVGSACALALVMRGVAREVLLVDRTRARAKAVATDIRSGAPLSESTDIRDGDYADLAGVAVAMITSGVNEKSGGATDRNDPVGRLRLLDKNAELYRELLPRIFAAAPEAVLIVVTDPPDPLADLAQVLAKHDRVLSTGPGSTACASRRTSHPSSRSIPPRWKRRSSASMAPPKSSNRGS